MRVESQVLSVLGPNLHGPEGSDGWLYTFIVHAAACPHIRTDQNRYGGEVPWYATFHSKAELVDDVYDFLGGDNSEDGDPMYPWQRGYGNEFRFRPCVAVPDELTSPTNDEKMHLELMLEKEMKRYGNYV